ncbi:phosphohistidine phosphatase SixA [Motiliproteus sp. MSK22-1]|uniref:phosphohistidine phosphatase SixA n=1 Tax=Motiliproteus sp. MSK22-1 TaxID=1897630 RepID=UPI0009775AA3|nr:phosphohistidine phosphatase SixA [Motiliproteus sp. MSK22-1]OMH38721.1 phosphohistidine phosphatase SixA [Motiliproteus sp. MSK22-1]
MSRTVFFLRHGEAGNGLTDRHRPLTERGRKQVEVIVDQQKNSLGGIPRIYCSPYWRAQSTASIVLDSLEIESPVETVHWLAPGTDLQLFIDRIEPLQDRVLLVGHNPLLTNAINSLAGYVSGRKFLDTGMMAAIEYEVAATGCGELLWIRGGD